MTRRPKLRDELITLAHGAGGKATRALVEGLFLEELAQPAARRRSATRRCSSWTARGSRSRPTPTSSSPLFFPGGDIGELAVNGTVNDLAVAGARAALRSRPGSWSRRASRSPTCAGSSRRWRARPSAAGVAVVDRRHQGGRARQGATASTSRPPASAVVRRGRSTSAPAACARATACSSPGRSATTAWRCMVARGELAARGRARERHARRCTSSPRRCSSSATALRWMRDPTRGGLATALNELAQAAGLAVALDEAALPRPARGRRRRARSSGSTRSTSRTRASSSRSSRPRRPTRRSTRLRAHPLGARRGDRRRGRGRARGARPARHRLRRQPDRRHARRRPAAADLLAQQGVASGFCSTRRRTSISTGRRSSPQVPSLGTRSSSCPGS